MNCIPGRRRGDRTVYTICASLMSMESRHASMMASRPLCWDRSIPLLYTSDGMTADKATREWSRSSQLKSTDIPVRLDVLFPRLRSDWVEMAWRNGFSGLHDVSPREVLSDRYNQYLSMRPQLQQSSNKKPKMAAGVTIPPRRLSPEKNLIRKAKVARWEVVSRLLADFRLRYLEKRKRRTWGHKIRYASRKAYAENRLRIKGRFAKQADLDALKLEEQELKKWR